MKFLFLILFSAGVHCIDLCGDGSSFSEDHGDINCYKVIAQPQSEQDGVQSCKSIDESASLVTIKSKEELNFVLARLANYTSTSDQVWIGLEWSDEDQFKKWQDGSLVNYENWSKDAAKDGSERCVAISLRKDDLGQWDDESCTKKALVVCKIRAKVTVSSLINYADITDQRINELVQATTNLNTRLIESNNLITELQDKQKQSNDKVNKLIPIGFIYTQLPNQTSPSQLWPDQQWTEVTNQYQGLFFRAEGGQSEPFGQIQQANQSWISNARIKSCHYNTQSVHDCGESHFKLSQHNWFNTYGDEKDHWIDRFTFLYTTGGEVRPENTAIKIWKRTG